EVSRIGHAPSSARGDARLPIARGDGAPKRTWTSGPSGRLVHVGSRRAPSSEVPRRLSRATSSRSRSGRGRGVLEDRGVEVAIVDGADAGHAVAALRALASRGDDVIEAREAVAAAAERRVRLGALRDLAAAAAEDLRLDRGAA